MANIYSECFRTVTYFVVYFVIRKKKANKHA